MIFQKDERAVTEVIGEILMVAITVIVAAIIAAYLFGWIGTTPTHHNVASMAKRTGGNVTVIFSGGPDARDITKLTYSGEKNCTGIGGNWGSGITNPSVGSYCTIISPAKVHVILSATFTDNSTAVILVGDY